MKSKMILATLIFALTPKTFGATCGRVVDIPIINEKGIFVVYQGEQAPVRVDTNPYNLSLLISTMGNNARYVCLGDAAVKAVPAYKTSFHGHNQQAPSVFSSEICGTPILLEMSPKLLDQPFNGMPFDSDTWLRLKVSDPENAKSKGAEIVQTADKGANAQLLVSAYTADRFLASFAASVGRSNLELCFSPSPQRSGTFDLTGVRPINYNYLK